MTDKKVDSISNTKSDIPQVEGQYWSEYEQPHLGPMTRSRAKIQSWQKLMH